MSFRSVRLKIIIPVIRPPHISIFPKGVGEPPVIAAPAAIANAIRDAIGARLTELPITGEALRRALAS